MHALADLLRAVAPARFRRAVLLWPLAVVPLVAPMVAFALAAMEPDPSRLTFATRCVRSRAADQTVAVTNQGSPEARDVIVSISPAADADVFPLSGTTRAPSVPPRAVIRFGVGFVPRDAGGESARAVIQYDVVPPSSSATPSPSPQPRTTFVALSGRGIDRFIDADPRRVNFGTVRVKRTKRARVRIHDDGATPLRISRMYVDGPQAAEFTFETDEESTVTEDDPLTLEVTFKPKKPGARIADLVVESNSCENPRMRIPLGGIAAVPDLSVMPDRIRFGGREIGKLSRAKRIMLTNQGGWPLRVTRIEVEGAAEQEFFLEEEPRLPRTLKPGVSFEILMRFSPVVEGRREAFLRVVSNDPDSRRTNVRIVGSGTPPPSPEPTDTAPAVALPTAPPPEAGFVSRYRAELTVGAGVALFFLGLLVVRRLRSFE